MKRTTMLVLLLASAFSVAVTAHPQSGLTDEQARKLAADAVAKVTSTQASQLNTKRREDLEDALFSFQIKIAGHIRKAAYFYNVVDGGYQITPNEVTYSTPAHQWLVAVPTAGDATYGLEGFENGEAAFDKLISDARAQIRDVTQAENFTRFYLGTVYGNADNVVYDELRLRHKIEEHFVGYADSQESTARKEQRFRTWWTAFKAKSLGKLAPTTKAEAGNQYRVTVNVLGMTVGRPPELSQWSIQVQGDGMTRLLAKRPLFPAPSKSAASKPAPTDGRSSTVNPLVERSNKILRY